MAGGISQDWAWIQASQCSVSSLHCRSPSSIVAMSPPIQFLAASAFEKDCLKSPNSRFSLMQQNFVNTLPSIRPSTTYRRNSKSCCINSCTRSTSQSWGCPVSSLLISIDCVSCDKASWRPLFPVQHFTSRASHEKLSLATPFSIGPSGTASPRRMACCSLTSCSDFRARSAAPAQLCSMSIRGTATVGGTRRCGVSERMCVHLLDASCS
mmetsp:Transcript_354/g.1186  ORF Transcript_354/g.1186 Transcript_354/m.1186 type:complete len:210 (+) Transcript_354:250-879(+)